MKILWVVNHYMDDLAKELGKPIPISGSWLVETSKKLKSFNDIEVNIVCPTEFNDKEKTINNINYYLLKMNSIDKYIKPTKKLSNSCTNLLDEIKPDIIHIQGSEFAFGLEFLLQKDIPVVISIQGLISEIVKKHYTWAGLKDNKNHLSINNIIIQLPQTLKNIRNKFRAKAEIKQLKLCDYIIGRTIWDRAHSYFHNPTSRYYLLQETMRDTFFKTKWDFTKANEHIIFCAGGYGSPLKGAHKVLEAVALLKSEFPNIKLCQVDGQIVAEGSFDINKQKEELLEYEKNIKKEKEIEIKEEEYKEMENYFNNINVDDKNNNINENINQQTNQNNLQKKRGRKKRSV